MPKDLKGIHQYREDDDEPSFSGTLNLLAESVSDAMTYFSGPAANRQALDPAPKGAMWQDTDGTEALYSADPNGQWRQHEGYFTLTAGTWTTVVANIVARSATRDLPIVLAADETIMATPTDHSGNGFTTTVLNHHVREAAKTTLHLRQFQVAGSATQPISMAWRIVKKGSY